MDFAPLCLSQIKSGHIGGVARRELGGKECARLVRGRGRSAHLSPKINASVSRCDNSCTTAVCDGGVARRTQNVVEAFPADRTDQPFGISILPWGMRRCWSVADAHRSESADKDLTIGAVPVTNEIAGSLFPAACFRELICDPFCGWR